MTQEDKNLLLKDLCGRLFYGVRVKELESIKESELYLTSIYHDNVQVETVTGGIMACSIKAIKPYLRSMSSMTEEEVKEFAALESIDVVCGNIKITCVELSVDAIDWLNKKMFDYRGLIPMGLALEAPERMYKEK